MKKLLSIILALAMILTLVPSVFANGEAETDGIKIEYSFLKADYVDAADTTAPHNYITYLTSGGRLEYDADNSTTTNKTISVWNSTKPYLICQKNGEYITFKIRVPKGGKYSAALLYNVTTSTSSGIGSMYILPGDTVDIESALKTAKPVFENINFAGNAATPTAKSETFTADVAGEYYMVWQRTGENGNAMRPARLILTQGTTDTPALIYADVTLGKTEIDAGVSEETEIALSNVYMSDGESATDTSAITYTSSDESVAKIEKGKVKAVCHGTATISAEVGDYVLGSTKLTVTNSRASKVTVEYSFKKSDYTSTDKPDTINYTNSKGRIAFDSDSGWGGTFTDWTGSADGAYYNMDKNGYVALKIRVPEAGLYRAQFDYLVRTSGATSDIYVLPEISNDIAGVIKNTAPLFANVNFKGDAKGTGTVTAAFNAETAGEYYLVFSQTSENGPTRPAKFTLDGNGTETSLIYSDISFSATTLEVNGTTTLTKGNAYLSNGDSTTDLAGVTYKTTNEAVATISDTTITAIGEGTAKIQAVRADGYILDEETITVSRPKAPTVSFYAESNVDDCPIEITATDVDNNEVEAAKAATLNRGAGVTVNAPEKEGYLFVGWFRGSKDTGRLVWADSEYTFNAMTHTMLTAVYEEAPEKAYYNFNGEFLGTEEPSSDPTMLGYNFDGWNKTVYNNLTRCVANYLKDKEKIYSVTIPSGISEAKDEDAYYYDTKVTLTSDIAVTWLRDDEPVAYGETYTFYVWDDVKITTDTTVNTMPKVILDSSKSGAYMIEYDAGDKTIIEKGIIFGNAGDEISVESCKEKMNSQRSEARGQFTASSAYTKARGYLIYKDGNEYKVIYAD